MKRGLVTSLLAGLLLAGYAQSQEKPQDKSQEKSEERSEEQPFYKTLNPPPAPELSPDEALASFSIAPGFSIELVAAEPLVEDPVAVTWDEAGSMYVVEMRGFMPDAYGKGDKAPVGVVVRLDDADNDGELDTRTVLQDKLVLPRAIAIVNEGLLIAEPPNLWLCPGKTNNIDCSKKVALGEYGNQPGSVEHAENGLLPAIDNWIYNAKSNRRMKIVDAKLVTEPTLFRGQWGITQDNNGTLYYNTNSNLLLGDTYDAQPVINAGNQGAPGLNVQVSRNDQLFAVRVNPGVNRAYVPGVLRKDGRLDKPTSASGMVVYRGNQFGEDFVNHVFVTEPAANAIAQLKLTTGNLSATTEHILYPDEKWQQREFLASTDERFRAVDVTSGPDGALYVVDMYRGIIQDHVFLSDQLREEALSRGLDKPVGMGRLWKVTRNGTITDNPAIPTSTEKLVDLLSHKNSWHRETAQRLLLTNDDNSVILKLQNLVATGDAVTAMHAIWTLQGKDNLSGDTLKTALERPETNVQLTAMRAGRSQLSAEQLMAMAGDDNADIAHHATLYLGRFNAQDDVMAFLANELIEWQADPIRRSGIRAASAGAELTLAKLLQGIWTAESETNTSFMAELFTQALRGTPELADSYLDLVLETNEGWLQTSILKGLQEVSADEGFERIGLSSAHPIFVNPPEGLWPMISKARRSFTWQGDDLAVGASPLSPAQKSAMELGRNYYANRCAICHNPDGRGIASLGPPLVESEWVTGPTERLIRIILHGLQGEIEVKGETWNGVMPGHTLIPGFDDSTAAGLLTYLHRAWGHTGRAIDPGFVEEVRLLEKGRSTLWTSAELDEIDINTHYRKYAGTYGGGQFLLKLNYNGSRLEISSVFFNGPLEDQGDNQFLFEPRQFLMEFVEENGVVTGLKALGMGGAVLPKHPGS